MIIEIEETSVVKRAVRFYWIQTSKDLFMPEFSEILLTYHYVPLFKRQNKIYMHSPSIIPYCHEYGDFRFHRLTQTKFCAVFPELEQIQANGTHQFRVISVEEFKQMAGWYE